MLGVDLGINGIHPHSQNAFVCYTFRLFDLDFLNFNAGFNVRQKVYAIGQRMKTGGSKKGKSTVAYPLKNTSTRILNRLPQQNPVPPNSRIFQWALLVQWT